MEQEGLFKSTAFGGFDRKSVLAYIDTLTQEHHTYEEEMQNKFLEFSKAQDSQVSYIQKLEFQGTEQKMKLETLAAQLEIERAATPQAASEINDLMQKNGVLEKKYSDIERELNIQLERNRQLQFKLEGASFKSQKYDEMSTQIGDAMIVAKSNADKMVTEASNQAEILLGDAQVRADSLLEQVRENTGRKEQEAQSQVRQMLEQARLQAAQAIEQAEAQAAETTSRTQAQVVRFSSEAGSFKSDTTRLRKSIEEILFVLNDRVDVMQELVRHMENHCDRISEEFHFSEKGADQPLVEAVDDEAGLFGNVMPEASDSADTK